MSFREEAVKITCFPFFFLKGLLKLFLYLRRSEISEVCIVKKTIAAIKKMPTTILDKVVEGTMSPYPTVVIVMSTKYKAASKVNVAS